MSKNGQVYNMPTFFLCSTKSFESQLKTLNNFYQSLYESKHSLEIDQTLYFLMQQKLADSLVVHHPGHGYPNKSDEKVNLFKNPIKRNPVGLDSSYQNCFSGWDPSPINNIKNSCQSKYIDRVSVYTPLFSCLFFGWCLESGNFSYHFSQQKQLHLLQRRRKATCWIKDPP